jgi:hypothetical protein
MSPVLDPVASDDPAVAAKALALCSDWRLHCAYVGSNPNEPELDEKSEKALLGKSNKAPRKQLAA